MLGLMEAVCWGPSRARLAVVGRLGLLDVPLDRGRLGPGRCWGGVSSAGDLHTSVHWLDKCLAHQLATYNTLLPHQLSAAHHVLVLRGRKTRSACQ